MAFATVTDPLLAAALWIGCGAFAATAAMLAFIFVLRLVLLRRLAREHRVAALWNPLLAECAVQVPERVPPLAKRDVRAFLLLWCRAQESLRGEAQSHLVELARRADAGRLARTLLREGDPAGQLLALIVLGHLRDAQVVPLLKVLVPAGASLVSITAAHALLRIDPKAGLPRVIGAAAKRDDWPLARVISLLRECDPAQVGAVLAVALQSELRARAPGPGIARLLRLHPAAHDGALRPAVVQVLNAAQPSETLAAALAALWHPQDVGHARRMVGHPDWVVRVAAARALGRLGGREDVERLAALLSDASWWVRYRAAQALCALPGVDAGLLDRLGAGALDRFAADILAQARADGTPA